MKKKIAFICVHNSCRSQIAEALGKKLASDVFESYSAGTETKPQINQDAVRLTKQVYGIDMDDYAMQHNLPTGFFEIKFGDGILVDDSIVDLTPEQFVDYLAVVGDKADNIPGVNRVGPATIVPLLQKYQTLDAVYNVIHDAVKNNNTEALYATWKSKLGIKTNPINLLLKDENNAYLSRKLAKIETNIEDVPCDISKYMLNINA